MTQHETPDQLSNFQEPNKTLLKYKKQLNDEKDKAGEAIPATVCRPVEQGALDDVYTVEDMPVEDLMKGAAAGIDKMASDIREANITLKPPKLGDDVKFNGGPRHKVIGTSTTIDGANGSVKESITVVEPVEIKYVDYTLSVIGLWVIIIVLAGVLGMFMYGDMVGRGVIQ